MAANSATQLVSLDFETIKSNLKTFLKSQNKIQDYDFEGSNISVLLDVLAYNTWQQNYYLNMIANEMFLDTAVLKDSIVSHVKELNYVPRSAQGAKAVFTVKVTPSGELPSSINIDKYTKFTSTIGGNSYSFYTEDDYTILPSTDTITSTTVYQLANVEVYEGTLTREFFTVNSTNNYSITISNKDADTRFLDVTVRESNTSSANTRWVKASTIYGLNSTSNVFFIEPEKDDLFKISFGDGLFGRKPSLNNIVSVTYRIASGDAANNGKTFTCANGLRQNSSVTYTNVAITTSSNSIGGAAPETIEEIKRNAPRSFQVQERAVTANDFKIITQARFPEVENILAFGGEELTPPKFGKVILAVDLVNADGVPEAVKSEIAGYLEKRTPVSIDVEVITPEFIYLETTATVSYNISTTTATPSTIQSKVLSALTGYANSNINRFDCIFRNSKAVAASDASDLSIISTQLLNRPYKKISPTGALTSYKLEFNNELKKDSIVTTETKVATYEPAVQSSLFTYGSSTVAYFVDDGKGNLLIVRSDAGDTFTILKYGAGTVNYSTGQVNILPIAISAYSGSTFNVYTRTVSRDIRTAKQSILQLNAADIKIKVVQERV